MSRQPSILPIAVRSRDVVGFGLRASSGCKKRTLPKLADQRRTVRAMVMFFGRPLTGTLRRARENGRIYPVSRRGGLP